MRRSWPSLCAAVAFAALGACGLTADFGGLQGGNPADAEAGSSKDDAAPPGDGGGADPDADAPGPPSGFCTARAGAKLCADFDVDPNVNAGWDAIDRSLGAVVRRDDIAYSPPGSFESAIAAGPTAASARLYEGAPLTITRAHAEFRMLLEPSDCDCELFVLHQETSDGTTYGVFYKESAGSLLLYVKTLSGDGGRVERVRNIGPPPATWLKVEIDFEIADSATVVIKHDGAVVVREPVPTSTPTRASLFFALGLYAWVPRVARARFDDVVFDWE